MNHGVYLVFHTAFAFWLRFVTQIMMLYIYLNLRPAGDQVIFIMCKTLELKILSLTMTGGLFN